MLNVFAQKTSVLPQWTTASQGMRNRSPFFFRIATCLLAAIVVFRFFGPERSIKSVAERWPRREALWQQSVRNREIIQPFLRRDDKQMWEPLDPYNLWDMFRPSFSCPLEMERVGRVQDGGKWVCGMTHYETAFPGPSTETNRGRRLIIYSAGIKDDSSFEAEMLNRTNAEIWGVDPSVNGWAAPVPSPSNRAHFHKLALGGSSDSRTTTLWDLMARNGHDFIDILKIDIEGHEFDTLTVFMNDIERHQGDQNKQIPIIPIGQVLIELHVYDKTERVNVPRDIISFRAWWERLEQLGMRPVFNEHNLIGNAVRNRPKNPQFIEYTWINAHYTGKQIF